VEAYGTLDELNAHLGLLNVAIADCDTKALIEQIENHIITLGSYLANDKECECHIGTEEIAALENAIDNLEATLPPMREFVLPGGNEATARANVARTVCRRAERAIVSLQEENHVDNNALVYINRLSDYLFLLFLSAKERRGTALTSDILFRSALFHYLINKSDKTTENKKSARRYAEYHYRIYRKPRYSKAKPRARA
jgi:cob(I)alamin adenosyltransferase